MVLNINTRDLRKNNKVHKNQDKVIWRASSTERENHTDTHCFGATFRPISFIEEDYTVPPLLSEYTKQVNIPISTGVTILALDSGEVVIPKVGKYLWF